jgi:hypothetical protein
MAEGGGRRRRDDLPTSAIVTLLPCYAPISFGALRSSW